MPTTLGYLRTLIKRTLRDTGTWRGNLLLGPLLFAIGFSIHARRSGMPAALEELDTYLVYGLVPVGVVGLALLAGNLLFRVPCVLWLEQRSEVESLRSRIGHLTKDTLSDSERKRLESLAELCGRLFDALICQRYPAPASGKYLHLKTHQHHEAAAFYHANKKEIEAAEPDLLELQNSPGSFFYYPELKRALDVFSGYFLNLWMDWSFFKSLPDRESDLAAVRQSHFDVQVEIQTLLRRPPPASAGPSD